MPKNIDITIAPTPEGLKPRATKGFRGSLRVKALWGLALALVFTSVALAAGYRCNPCKQNYYCSKGISHECPTDRPVTFGTGAKSVDECFSCADRDGASYPFYDAISGDCMACWQVPATTTPYWNGTTCAACPDDTEWDSESLKCVESGPACAFKIPHDDTTLCLVESVDYTAFESVTPQSENDETTEFLTTYGIANVSSVYPDYWAGAMKYCQDKGLRLTTMDEIISIVNALHETSIVPTEDSNCYAENSAYTGVQYGCTDYPTTNTVVNEPLFEWLSTNSQTDSPNYYSFTIYSSAELWDNTVWTRDFSGLDAEYSYFGNYEGSRAANYYRAICVK